MVGKATRKKARRSRVKIATDLPRHGNRSIIVAVSLLKIVAGLGRPSTLSEIAGAAGMSPTRTHRYLMGLVSTELLEQNPLTSRYYLGAQVIELGVSALGSVDAIRFGTEALVTLTERVRIASLLCAWGTHGPTVLRWEQADLTSAVRIREGRALSLLHSAAGRIFLAYLPSEVTRSFVDAETGKLAANAGRQKLVTQESILRLKEEIRARGLSVAVGEEVATFAAMAAPVFDANGKLALALTLISTVAGFDTDLEGEVPRALKETADQLSRRLGWTPLTAQMAGKPMPWHEKDQAPQSPADH